MKKILSLWILMTGLAFTASAHEGHNHDAPTTLKAPKGGMIKALDEARVEIVAKGSEFKIYFYDLELKPLAANMFKVTSSAQLPRTKKEEPVSLVSEDSFLVGNYDAKGAHRYMLKLKIEDLKSKISYDLTFNIEPRK